MKLVNKDKRKICQILIIPLLIGNLIISTMLFSEIFIPIIEQIAKYQTELPQKNFDWKTLPILEFFIHTTIFILLHSLVKLLFLQILSKEEKEKKKTQNNTIENTEDLYQPGTVVIIKSFPNRYYYIVKKTQSPLSVVISSFINECGCRGQFEENIDNLEIVISSNQLSNTI